MKILVEDWQVKEETKNGIYIDIDYGLLNSGAILVPSHQVNKFRVNSEYWNRSPLWPSVHITP